MELFYNTNIQETYQQRGKIHHSDPSHPVAAAGPSSVLAAGTVHTPVPRGCLSLGPAERCYPLAGHQTCSTPHLLY